MGTSQTYQPAMIKKFPLLLLVCFAPLLLLSQQIQLLNSGSTASLRGLSVVSDQVIWASGSAGSVGRSLDGGATWQWNTVKGFEKREFRDIAAFDANTAVIIAIAEPAQILKTSDGGQTWKIVFTDSTKGMFLDAMDFYDRKNGVVVGDPVNNKFFVAKTTDGGNTWQPIPPVMMSKTVEGESGCFAASGTNIVYFKNRDYLFVSGGMESRLHDDAGSSQLPIIQGKETTGANSIAVLKRKVKVNNCFIIVGGDFNDDKDTTRNCFFTEDGGTTWQRPSIPPNGYRSCVMYITKKTLLTCGTSGVDFSSDRGHTWTAVTKDGFHVCAKARKGKVVYLAGARGKMAKVKW